MSKARIMSAGTVGTSKRVRVNGPEGGGNALQGLPPICNMRSSLVPYVRTRADGENRNLIFCVNQLGGVGAKRSQFGPGNKAGEGKTGGCSREGQYGGRHFGTALHGNFALFGLLGVEEQANHRLREILRQWWAQFDFMLAFVGGNVNNLPPRWEPDIPRGEGDIGLRLSGTISQWDTRDVTDMSYLFSTGSPAAAAPGRGWTDSFNITGWDTSNVTNMAGMFEGNIGFGGVQSSDIYKSNYQIGGVTADPESRWDVSNVTNMENMFHGCHSFNVDIRGWNTSKVTNMAGMFRNASFFNRDIENWDVSNVQNMTRMFEGTQTSPNIGNWHVSNVQYMERMFLNCWFNSDIGNWDVRNVKSMERMFFNARAFNQDLKPWVITPDTSTDEMFGGEHSVMEEGNKPDLP